jgi:Fe-Mn family superoxide dismutase
MEIHHDRHHQAYVANLNNLAKTNPQLATAKIETCSAI